MGNKRRTVFTEVPVIVSVALPGSTYQKVRQLTIDLGLTKAEVLRRVISRGADIELDETLTKIARSKMGK